MNSLKMMFHKHAIVKLCRLCGKEKQQGTDLFNDKSRGSVLLSIINKYFAREIISITSTDRLSKNVCSECEKVLCSFDEFCLMVANVQKQLVAPSIEINFAEDMLCPLKDPSLPMKSSQESVNVFKKSKPVCPICGKTFRCLAHLKRHNLIHTGQRPYICDVCNMSFNQQEVLSKHKLVHTENIKPFQCFHCNQSFKFKVSLKSHILNYHSLDFSNVIGDHFMSTQNETLQCLDCGKQFATKYKLKRHSRYHSGERPYECNYCNRRFSQSSNLKVHQKKYHQINYPPLVTPKLLHPHHQTECSVTDSLNTYQPVFLTETEIQDTLNETINSSDMSASYLNKPFDNQLYIDEEIETMLDQDLDQLEHQKYASSMQDKGSFCLKQPETPELLQSLLYDE